MKMTSEQTNENNTVIDVFLTLSANQAAELRAQLIKDWRAYQGGIIGAVDASGRNVYIQFMEDGSANLGRRVSYDNKYKAYKVTAVFKKTTTVSYDIQEETYEAAVALAKELSHEYQFSRQAKVEETMTIMEVKEIVPEE